MVSIPVDLVMSSELSSFLTKFTFISFKVKGFSGGLISGALKS